ncbi:Metallo-dependent phosphatase [Xylariaceae sp. FL0255]|nr:Metallo-dependent phosphatase [Xylariaceae sp. FL0255]
MAPTQKEPKWRHQKRLLQTRPSCSRTLVVAFSFILALILLGYTSYLDLSSVSISVLPPSLHRSQPSSVNSINKMDPSTTIEETSSSSRHKPYPHLSTLDASLLPTIPSGDRTDTTIPRRLILIGDVHGHSASLRALLHKTGYNPAQDHVIFVGDMVNKGPDSAGVVSVAMSMNASGVRGNHEDRVLGAWEEYQRHRHYSSSSNGNYNGNGAGDNTVKAKEKESGRDKSAGGKVLTKEKREGDLATAQSLSSKQRAWLGDLPLILKIGNLGPRYGDVLVVHAGLVSGVPLPDQDPYAVMNMRTLLRPDKIHKKAHKSTSTTEDSNAETALSTLSIQDVTVATPQNKKGQEKEKSRKKEKDLIPSSDRTGKPWAEFWTQAQKSLRPKSAPRTTIVYGHDARAGLQMRKYAFGIDTGCGNGKELTALIFEVVGTTTTTSTTTGGEEMSESESDSDDDDDNDDDGEEVDEVSTMGKKDKKEKESGKKKKDKKKKGPRIRHRLVSVSCADET